MGSVGCLGQIQNIKRQSLTYYMSDSLISVIVPVYNSEQTLHRCIDSILGQTYRNFELLLINDGSKDRSGEICDEYARKDSRVKVFHKENGGVSSARNVGLDNARGEWVTFVDSDDRVGEMYLELFSSNFDADILLMDGYYNCSSENCEIFTVKGLHACHNVEDVIASYLDKPIIKTPWAKLFRNDILLKLRFDERLRIGEDLSFVCSYMSYVKTIAIIDISQSIKSGGYFYSTCDNITKYGMSVREAVDSLKIIFGYYKRLNVRCVEFESNIIELFYVFCQKDIRNNGDIWYNDGFIRRVLLRNAISSHKYLKCIKVLVSAFPGVFYLRRFFKQI